MDNMFERNKYQDIPNADNNSEEQVDEQLDDIYDNMYNVKKKDDVQFHPDYIDG